MTSVERISADYGGHFLFNNLTGGQKSYGNRLQKS